MATLPVEDRKCSVEIETLVYERLDGGDRGWRVELLVEQLTNKLEQKFLLCGYCSGLMRDACLLEKKGKQELRCFVCIPEGVTWQPALINRDAINEKIIRCPLKERGCNWTENVSTVIQHLNDCGKEDRRRKTLRLEGNLSTGKKELRCEFCGRGVRACEMNPHLGECSEFPVDCPNGCEVAGETGTRQVKRGDVPLHLASCPLQTVKCPYWDYGCGEETERRQLDLHERDSMHTHFKLAMKEMEQKVSDLKVKISNRNLEYSFLCDELKELNDTVSTLEKDAELKMFLSTLVSGKLEWKIKGVKQKIEEKEDTYSDPFYVGLYKCQVNIEWDYDNTGKVGCFICIMKGEFDDKLKWPFIFRYKFVLLNQNRNEDDHKSSDDITKDILQKYPQSFQRPTEIRNDGIGSTSFISHTDLLTEKYCKENSLSLHISIEQLPIL